MDVDNPQAKPRLLWDLSVAEHYKNPGYPVYRQLSNGALVIRQDADSIFLSGIGSSPNGDRPFLDQLNLKTLKKQNVCSSAAIRISASSCVSTFPFTGPRCENLPHLASIRERSAERLYAHPRPILRCARRRSRFHFHRRRLDPHPGPHSRSARHQESRTRHLQSAPTVWTCPSPFTLHPGSGYQEGTRLPTILYAYPLDYAQASVAGQVVGSQGTFTGLQGYRLLLLAGYAIIDRAAFPIVGDPKKAYDTYLGATRRRWQGRCR